MAEMYAEPLSGKTRESEDLLVAISEKISELQRTAYRLDSVTVRTVGPRPIAVGQSSDKPQSVVNSLMSRLSSLNSQLGDLCASFGTATDTLDRII